ncbi:MAG TPA: hypothetical protein VIK32_07410, partial [Candidatus Limnocylindrales bacterium]
AGAANAAPASFVSADGYAVGSACTGLAVTSGSSPAGGTSVVKTTTFFLHLTGSSCPIACPVATEQPSAAAYPRAPALAASWKADGRIPSGRMT